MAKRIILIALVIMMMTVFAGCSMVTVNEERDGQRAVATVNGVDVLKKDITTQLELYLSSMMGITEEDTYYQEYYDMYVDSYLETAIIYELCRQKLEAAGVEQITAEQQEEIQSELNAAKEWAESYADMAILEEDYESDKAYQAAREAFIADYLESSGYNDGTMEIMLKNEALMESTIAYLMKDFNPTEEEIKAYYDQQLKDQQTVIDEQLSAFTTFEDEGLLIYTPEGIRYIKYVYVALEDEAQDEIAAADYSDKEALREEKLAEIQDTADAALAAAKEDFDAAIEEYNPENDDMLDEETRKTGVRIYLGSSDFESEVIDEAETLAKEGDMSGLIATDTGYYIIQMVGEEEAGIKAYDEAKDAVLEHMTAAEEESVFTTASGQWLDEAEIKYYRNRL